MTERSFAFLVNPVAGGGAAPDAVVPVARILREHGATVEVTYSPGPKATAALVATAVAADQIVVAVGGDGMLASLAGPVATQGGTLGLVPAGRGNDFARMLGLPDDPAGQAAVLLSASPRAVDLLAWAPPGAEQRMVAGSVYAGVDAQAAAIVDRLHWLPRFAQYPVAAVRALLGYRPARFRLGVDGVVSEYDAATVVVANSRYYGKGMKIAPAAEVSDGLLDVVVIEADTKRALMKALPSVYDGGHIDLPNVRVLRGTRVELAADAATPVPVGGDGEPLGRLPGLDDQPATVTVAPAALQVLAPQRAADRGA